MNGDELHSFLEHNNTHKAAEWDLIKREFNPETEEINGEEVYVFDMIFDQTITPIEDPIGISQQLPTAFIPMHIHHYIELIYVYRGKCTVVFQNVKRTISEGEIIIIEKKTPHAVNGLNDKDIVIDIKLKHDYLSSSFLSRFTHKSIISQFLIDSLINNRSVNNYLYFPFNPRSKIKGIMAQIMCEYFDKDFCSADMINSYMFILFTELIRHGTNIDNVKSRDSKQDVIALDFLKYIEKHYMDCSLTEMAAHFNYHPNYASSVLKKSTGKSFKDLLQIQRLNKAALYLTNSDLTVGEIAEKVGYTSLSFFYKKFHEIFSQTPKDYRETNL
ncbi:AraC family transcriptional regulator [Metabacillus endolithicus]|uniref:AraC family transcriptional regulator n=1 Tax=Metabacillus endolithicus TaxID=1535204 RepID=A0ABW5C1E2_9BACI|nr:AraC family transcriptional regulator [Metabacillus endolithicus]UPG62672.1 AraC family transcriptional regulator [Metabacillus endolithicus]